MNNAPFKVGDRVVALYSIKGVRKGKIYVVQGIYVMRCCNIWIIAVGVPSELNSICACPECRAYHNFMLGQNKYYASDFALVQPRHEDAAIDEAIIEQARELIGVSETVAPVGEPVNN